MQRKTGVLTNLRVRIGYPGASGGGHGTRTLKSVRACPEPVEMKGGISLYSGGCNSLCNSSAYFPTSAQHFRQILMTNSTITSSLVLLSSHSSQYNLVSHHRTQPLAFLFCNNSSPGSFLQLSSVNSRTLWYSENCSFCN